MKYFNVIFILLLPFLAKAQISNYTLVQVDENGRTYLATSFNENGDDSLGNATYSCKVISSWNTNSDPGIASGGHYIDVPGRLTSFQDNNNGAQLSITCMPDVTVCFRYYKNAIVTHPTVELFDANQIADLNTYSTMSASPSADGGYDITLRGVANFDPQPSGYRIHSGGGPEYTYYVGIANVISMGNGQYVVHCNPDTNLCMRVLLPQ